VADVSGKAKLILDDSNGTTDCARWISKDRLVLDRFADCPRKRAEPLKPNTSTVVTIGETVKLKDAPRKWSIETVCPKSSEGFVRSADQGRLLIAKNIDRFESLDPAPAPCSECEFIGYAAQSCAPFFIEQSSSTTTELFFLNPTNWQKQRPTSITWIFANPKFLINGSARLMVAGDAPDKLLLIDTESGAVTPFFRTQKRAGLCWSHRFRSFGLRSRLPGTHASGVPAPGTRAYLRSARHSKSLSPTRAPCHSPIEFKTLTNQMIEKLLCVFASFGFPAGECVSRWRARSILLRE